MSTDHNFWRERRAEADSSRGLSAYQPNALPLSQTGSHLVSSASHWRLFWSLGQIETDFNRLGWVRPWKLGWMRPGKLGWVRPGKLGWVSLRTGMNVPLKAGIMYAWRLGWVECVLEEKALEHKDECVLEDKVLEHKDEDECVLQDKVLEHKDECVLGDEGFTLGNDQLIGFCVL